jgi:hypothetical protein
MVDYDRCLLCIKQATFYFCRPSCLSTTATPFPTQGVPALVPALSPDEQWPDESGVRPQLLVDLLTNPAHLGRQPIEAVQQVKEDAHHH